MKWNFSSFHKLNMADVQIQSGLNEAVLKRFDPYIKEVLDTAKYVALYRFIEEDNEWEKTDVEGCLFVYSRTGKPYHNILVLNRLNRDNLVEPITPDLDLQLQEPFLLYRNTQLSIFGIWFYEREECTRLTALITNLMQQAGGSVCDRSVNVISGRNASLYDMLSRAQESFVNDSKKISHNAKNNSPGVGETPKSVIEFFAKANVAPPKSSHRGSGAVVSGSQNTVDSKDKNPLNPLLHQLMSNPVHTVEHIEKQQRSVTPQATESKSFTNFIRPLSSGHVDTDLQQSAATDSRLDNGIQGFNFLRISSPSSQGVFKQLVADSSEVRPLSAPQSTILETPQKPALMPPAMFTPSGSKDNTAGRCEVVSNDFKDKPEPLTKKQLLQAINYLLKNDPDFVTKIHEAYIKSLTEMVI